MEKEDFQRNKIERIKELVALLDRASRAYYQEDREIMPDYRYDELYDELEKLEKETGVVLAGSPTVNVGYEAVSELPKEEHPSPMLSLDKTKDPQQLAAWLGTQEGVMSWKLDGLTIVLTYRDGRLAKAVTRGNGTVGEVVTANARVFVNLPVSIDFRGELVLRGEAVISYEDFEKINAEVSGEGGRYKNPRNLCSGSVRQLNNRVTAQRRVRFFAFSLVSAEGLSFKTRTEQFAWLGERGFQVVEHYTVTAETIPGRVRQFEEEIPHNPVPSDGLVLSFNDLAYGLSLGATAKFPRDSIAFKWRDEVSETVLRGIEWSASRTGLINPVAVFDPVELEGTTVSRASVHNVSVMRELGLGPGDRIRVYKANMIIPQVLEDLTCSGSAEIPARCPVCGSRTVLRDEHGVETLLCPNEDCQAKHVKRFTHFVSRDAMNIEGLSEATLEKLIDRGLVREFADLFHVENFRDEFINMEGLGEKSFDNLRRSVEAARHTTPERLLYSLGIPGIGKANARLISRRCHNRWDEIRALDTGELMSVDGIGEVLAESFTAFFADEKNRRTVDSLLAELDLDEHEEKTGNTLEGLTFVITGSLNGFANRNELKDAIEKAGGKVSGSVTGKTSYLINNDLMSNSGKNRKARELGVPVIDEETAVRWLNGGRN